MTQQLDALRSGSRLLTIKGAASGWWGSVWCMERLDWLAKVDPDQRCDSLDGLVEELSMQLEERRIHEAAA